MQSLIILHLKNARLRKKYYSIFLKKKANSMSDSFSRESRNVMIWNLSNSWFWLWWICHKICIQKERVWTTRWTKEVFFYRSWTSWTSCLSYWTLRLIEWAMRWDSLKWWDLSTSIIWVMKLVYKYLYIQILVQEYLFALCHFLSYVMTYVKAHDLYT